MRRSSNGRHQHQVSSVSEENNTRITYEQLQRMIEKILQRIGFYVSADAKSNMMSNAAQQSSSPTGLPRISPSQQMRSSSNVDGMGRKSILANSRRPSIESSVVRKSGSTDDSVRDNFH
uniref:Uncharacterized protein n=2 Tax=Lotharella globosa TaxID=91324 RepID=A0A7S3YQU6_9EUKA